MIKYTHKQLMGTCMLAGALMLGACTSTPPVTKEVSIVPNQPAGGNKPGLCPEKQYHHRCH